MNKLLFKSFICLFSFSLIISGCNEKEEPRFLELDKTVLTFEAGNGNQTITISSNENWTASNTAGWLTASPLSGTGGNTTVIVSVSENELPEGREAILVFNSETQTATVIIMQAAASPFIQLDRTTLNFGHAGGSQNITVSSNDSWTISGGTNWLTVSPQSGTGNATISVTASQNEMAEARNAALTFTHGTQTATVEITQEAASFIQSDRNTLNFNSAGGNQTVTITSSGSWTVSGGANWITVSPQSATGNATVTINAAINTTSQSRTSTLTFRHGTQTATLNITQEARILDNPQGVVIGGVRWATRNVGSPGTFAVNPESLGMFYQWNRRTGWSATGNVSGWNSTPSTTVNWARVNDPCPTGWRLPTYAEMETFLNTTNLNISLTNVNGTNGILILELSTGNALFLPAVGWRQVTNGVLNDAGFVGRYWSGTSTDGGAFHLWFDTQQIGVIAWNRANGFSVRCVAE